MIIPFIEVMDRGFDGKGNLRFGLLFRIIPPFRGEGIIRGWKRILAHNNLLAF